MNGRRNVGIGTRRRFWNTSTFRNMPAKQKSALARQGQKRFIGL
jgi:hypothetical protein